jgi:hypothetical protein
MFSSTFELGYFMANGWDVIAQSIQRLATGWTVLGWNCNEERFSAPV